MPTRLGVAAAAVNNNTITITTRLLCHNSRATTTPRRLFSTATVPSTLATVPPTLTLVPPGSCQFTSEEWTKVPLLNRWSVSPTSRVLRFATPDVSRPLNLSTCACILAMAELPDQNGTLEEVIRPYTPISTNAQIGYFDLLVKDYGTEGRLSTYLCNELVEGSSSSSSSSSVVGFKHIDLNVKIQAPSFLPYQKIVMLVGGTGITPMIQAAHAILGHNATTTNNNNNSDIVMLYGSKTSDDILGKELLDRWSESHDNLSVIYFLSNEPEEEEESSSSHYYWDGPRGYIDRAAIEKYVPSPDDKDSIIFLCCGPPPMYNALCGPREEKELSGLLKEMGYSAEQVYKF
mmetsp:Transcript_8414/g.12975  ORF Transcript_8414/g.12975 Transcript_8414/m.12975 type:complete len:347 (+) Transcript_8414:301-1341(+)